MTLTRATVRSFVSDLRRRRVFRVAGAYMLVGWIVVEAGATIFPLLGLPEWSPLLLLVLVALGFPAALVLAWAYDEVPGSRTEDAKARWRREQEILAAAVELPAGERSSFVRQKAGADRDLRDAALELVRAHEADGLLDEPITPHLPTTGGSLPGRIAAGSNVRHYEVLEKLGGGGMGIVYRARDMRLGRTVALKFLPPHLNHEREAQRRFVTEAQAAAALDHINICTLLEIGRAEDDGLFLAMPFYSGETLKQRFARGPLPLAEALDVMSQAALGLSAAHAKGIVHRDIKPANLMITDDGVLKIVDFGIAKLADVAVTAPEVTPGTVMYMSPEQARGDAVDSRTDVWSLGIVMYEALTGQRPYGASSPEMARQAILDQDLVPLRTLRPDIPESVAAVVRKALAFHRNDRFPTGKEFRHALSRLLSEGAGFAGHDDIDSSIDEGLRPEGERRQATVVVSTLAGFSGLLEVLTPADLELLIARLRETVEEVTRRFGGVVNRMDDDRIEILFGVPQSHEDHCFRAVRAALELHERVQGLQTPGMPTAVALQTGIDTGLVVARPGGDEGNAFRLAGGPAVAASRLHARSGPDEVWMTSSCQRVVGVFFETVVGEPMSLTPGSATTPYRALRLSGLRSRIEAAGTDGLTRYVGRSQEVSRLRTALDRARNERGGVMAIVGEAGVGKSRLLHEFRESVADEALTVLEGRCHSFGVPVAYLPFIEMLRGVLRMDGVEGDGRVRAVVEGLDRMGPELHELLPLFLELLSLSDEAHVVPRHLQGERLQHALAEALAGLLTVLSVKAPVLLLLEDWHWADEASNRVLRQIAEVAGDHALMVLVTSRPPAPEPPTSVGYEVVGMSPLDEPSTEELLRALFHAPALPAEFAQRVHQRTGGNPFFVEEVARTLMEEGALSVYEGTIELAGTPDGLQIPESVQAVIRARLDRLDRDTRDVVRLASVVGREFERQLLEQITGGSRLPHAIQALKAAGLIQQTRVVPDAAYRFNHALTREVAYASLLHHQLAEAHRRVGEAIERLHGPDLDEYCDRLADHFSRAGIWTRAVRYGLRAADRTVAVSAFGEARRQLERCEEWIGEMEEGDEARDLLVEVLLRDERVREFLGQREHQEQIIDRLLGLLGVSSDPARRAEVYQRQGDLHTLGHNYGVAEEALVESLRLGRASGEPFVIRNTLRSLGLLCWHQDRLEDALAHIQEAMVIDREQNDLGALVGEYSNLAAVLKGLGRLDEALEVLEDAQKQLTALQSGPSASRTYVNESYILHTLANLHRELGDSETAITYLEKARGLTDRERMPVQLSYHYTSLAHISLQDGEIEQALDLYRQAVVTSREADHALGLAQALRMLGGALAGFDREAEALLHLVEAAQIFGRLSDVEAEGSAWRSVARAAERLGDIEQSLEAWRRTADACRERGNGVGEAEALEGVGRCARHIGRPAEEVRELHLEALRLAETEEMDPLCARLLNVLGIVAWEGGAYEEAIDRYQHALTYFRRLDDDHGVGLMLNSIGASCRAAGRQAEALERLEAALPIHRSAGHPLLEGHALAILGDMALEEGRTKDAIERFAQSMVRRREAHDRTGEGWMHTRLAAAEARLGSPGKVRDHLVEARRIAEEVGSRDLASACEQVELASAHSAT